MADSVPSVKAVQSVPLGLARRGFCGHIQAIHVGDGAHGLTAMELERRLLELGFVEGAEVEVLHEGRWAVTRSLCASTTTPSRCDAGKPWPSSWSDRNPK